MVVTTGGDDQAMTSFTGTSTALTQAGVTSALRRTGADGPGLWAVLSVETSGCGYLDDRRPKMLFERHIFHRLTAGRFDARNADVSASTAGGYGSGGAHQYLRLAAAMQLDATAALSSASWGLGQILGVNHEQAGFASVETMVDAFVASEDNQLAGMAEFIAQSGKSPSLINKNWANFARLYNGPNFAKNDYDGKLKLFCGHYTVHGLPDIRVRTAQILLTFNGIDPGTIDGLAAAHTRDALITFQKSARLTTSGIADDATLVALQNRLA